MRRAPLAAAIAVAAAGVPIAVLAVSAATGQLLETTNYNATGTTSYVNLDQCNGGNLALEWNIQTVAGATFGSGGSYRVFASNTQPSGTNGTFCAESSSPSATPAITAGQVGSVSPATSAVTDLGIPGNTVVTTVGLVCDGSKELTQLWICAHWYDASGSRNGFAVGKFTLQTAKPGVVPNVSAQSGDSKLYVGWDLVTSGATVDHYIAEAYASGNAPPAAPDATARATAGTNSATITGLTNNVPYTVYVVAYSLGGNPSDLSAAATATPAATADFWTTYKARGGQEQGGCASGPGGGVALVGAAALLAVRRRRKP